MVHIAMDDLNNAPIDALKLATVCFLHGIGSAELSEMPLEEARRYGNLAGVAPGDLVRALHHIEALRGTLDPEDPRWGRQK